jgi:uncharacterized protein
VFLDHSDHPQDIEKAWEHLLARAQREGQAIAIAHPRINTIRFLRQALPGLSDHDIELVPISQLAIRRPGQLAFQERQNSSAP